MMVFKIPGCNIHASTIDNRIKLMKRMFHALAEMRDPMCSGFGWNDKKNASSQRKKSSTIGSSHPAAKGLLNKWFLHYDELSYVFGKDRATGGRVENFADVGSNDPVGFRDVSSLFVVEASSSVDVFYSTLLELGCTADGFFMASQKGPLTMNHFSHACFNVNRASIFYSDVKCLGDHVFS
ncbi:retrotransposon protein [Cucumis melo var. makuwa]|uniref:Retrotransposon protein n=1 Tax=Cucumis melo var. makuwa TaxID=1194695 RepID=A0A5D3DA87_CUCMM|nr:retrotransposon protein [Cucumis melo var. makuwa]TYK20380.1 retrotransposon protein [Cucumis melo var. makuwa]